MMPDPTPRSDSAAERSYEPVAAAHHRAQQTIEHARQTRQRASTIRLSALSTKARAQALREHSAVTSCHWKLI